ncbi:MAG: molecular chaperone DnaK [Betaproteobacteria bacterium HGW-Betaproteobacteria-7]|nr:MAG: molecular chaperone DnaK [Betaproteobacteria bacterium HGW-Betaproteobacteria-7]
MRDELRNIDDAIAESGQSAAIVELDQSSVGRVSRIDALQQQAIAQAAGERLKLRQRKLEAALARLQAGSYSICCDCGGEVERRRLDADPATPFCNECAAEREKP